MTSGVPGAVPDIETWSGKARADENFPVGSFLIQRKYPRPDASLLYLCPQRRRHRRFGQPVRRRQDRPADIMEDVLLGRATAARASAAALRASLARPAWLAVHATDLLIAFRRDATKLRYDTIDELVRLLPLLRGAGRPLRAGPAWRKPRVLPALRRAVHLLANT